MKLSIITINYNNKAGLEKTIESVMSQTWRDFEWIIIDGGSTDGSKEVIEELAKNPNSNVIYWCSEPDKGIYNAMNKGIVHAKGEYLNFMNSGDCFFDAGVLCKIMNNLSITCDVVVGNAINAKTMQPIRLVQNVSSLLEMLSISGINHQSTFVKRSLFGENLYDETLKIVSDWKFWLQTIVIGKASVCFIDVDVAIMDMGGVSATNHELHQTERKKVMDDLFYPGYFEMIERYQSLRNNDFITKTDYLKKYHTKLYIVCRRFVSLSFYMGKVISKWR